ncbi:hypothetical protein MAPG_11209 [Magnaporthiopsis poae ATCC 64411]|uniref:Uncharacterized protein n=1 Tax=Magnaporthiopsis poae (strain ATCC 64411 / 73-15) TaxID=644358 RepID=A0A0C4EEN5_MAGP6|nr:hypothetical protein MAPG_11209 [Magnaporthiopsis poae ATCC 64411]
MKPSSTLALALYNVTLLLQGTCSAYGQKAAYERTMLWSLYVMEDILGAKTGVVEADPTLNIDGDFKIAAGCVGTRPRDMTVLGVPGRCTLNEFLDHIWRQTPTIKKGPDGVDVTLGYDQRPVAKYAVTVKEPFPLDAKIIAGSITQIAGKQNKDSKEMVPFNGKNVKIAQNGHTGNMDERLLFPGRTDWPNPRNGVENFAKALELAGERFVELNNLWQELTTRPSVPDAKGELRPRIELNNKDHPLYKAHREANRVFNRARQGAHEAATFVQDIRLKDLHGYREKKADWRSLHRDFEPTFKTVDGRNPGMGRLELDVDTSAQTLANLDGTDKATAERKLNDFVVSMDNSPGGRSHLTALTSAQKTVRLMDAAMDPGPIAGCS